MKNLWTSVLCIFELLLFALPYEVKAMPVVDQTIAITKMVQDFVPYVFPDSENPHLFYLPYTQLKIVSTDWNPSLPSLSFSYHPNGLMFSVTVKPTLDMERLAPIIQEIKKDPQAKFRPLPILEGRYIPALRLENLIDHYIPDTSQTIGVEQSLADVEMPLTFLFDRQQADLVVMALNGGAALGINYVYTFKARITPSVATVQMSWPQIQREVQTATHTGNWIAGPSIERIVQKLHQNKVIDIQLQGEQSNIEPILSYITQHLLQACYTSIDPALHSIVTGYRPRNSGCNFRESKMTIVTESIQNVVAQAGFQLGGMCTSHPTHFNFLGRSGKIEKGCPSTIYGNLKPGEEIQPVQSRIDQKNPEVPSPL